MHGPESRARVQERGTIMAVAQTNRPSFAERWWMYQAERFPLGTHFPAILFFFAAAWFSAQALAGKPLQLGLAGGLAFVATFLTMLLLRVFDEFKDFEDDKINHPERVVQQGIVTLPELARLGAVIGAVMVAANVPLGWQAWVAFAAVIGFALLMRMEFFVPEWLKKHIMVYAITHQGIVPLLFVYLAVAAAGSLEAVFPKFWLAIVVAVGVGLCYELSRKFQAPEDETATLPTYTKALGPIGASIVAFLCLTAACSATVGLWTILKLPDWVQYVALAALATGGAGYGKYVAAPTRANAKIVKNLASVAIVLVQLGLVAGLVAKFPISWGGL